ncbi:MAG: STAS/SEC14 domain-containing protein [Zhongshania sp.]|uniref:STAS/SEC14 domain-containing protein n=1 Tax=Zhongshania sp. TaxID=1971902 RepID=UPI00262032BB|nr:STAS/SEC14 domain-containing protein [Zhongshania sp.]MDF1693736.1 STAS/SEC14 domain-containing protein [Zhongshania sp.]
MIEVIHNTGNRIDILINGKVHSHDMKLALDTLIEESENIENGVMVYRIVDFKFPSLAAMAVEFSRMPKLLRVMKKFTHIAVLTDKKWLKKASELEGKLFPYLEIKAFDFNDIEEAEMWLEAAA